MTSYGGYWPTKAAVWNPSGRIYPRYAPNYNSKIILEKVDESVPAPTETRYAIGRTVTMEPPHRPFGYIDYYKPTIKPVQLLDPVPATTRTAEVVTTASATCDTCEPKPFHGRTYRIVGYILIILATMILAFEIADVIVAALYKNKPCVNPPPTDSFSVPWFFSWVVPGIWGSIPIFITGILAIYVKDNYGRVFQALAILSSLSAFFFVLAILAINAAEEGTFLNYCNYASVQDVGSKIADPTLEGAKFALPIILIVLAIITFFVLLYLTVVLCYAYDECSSCETIVVEDETKEPPPCPAPVILPAATLPPPPPREYATGVPGRVVYMEAHNRGYAYANVPGYFTTQTPQTATTTIVKPVNTGYYWE